MSGLAAREVVEDDRREETGGVAVRRVERSGSPESSQITLRTSQSLGRESSRTSPSRSREKWWSGKNSTSKSFYSVRKYELEERFTINSLLAMV